MLGIRYFKASPTTFVLHYAGGRVRREGTVMFTDLRGFTTFSESLEPERVVEVINQYLGEMSEATP